MSFGRNLVKESIHVDLFLKLQSSLMKRITMVITYMSLTIGEMLRTYFGLTINRQRKPL